MSTCEKLDCSHNGASFGDGEINTCYFIQAIVGQANTGGGPIPDSDTKNGPMWKKKAWRTFLSNSRNFLVNQSCADVDRIMNEAEALTKDKLENCTLYE